MGSSLPPGGGPKVFRGRTFGKMLNDEIVRAGYAWLMTITANCHRVSCTKYLNTKRQDKYIVGWYTQTGTRLKILTLIFITLSLISLPLWDRYRIERDFTNTMRFLRYARLFSLDSNTAHAVIFEKKSAILQNVSTGKKIQRLKIGTLRNVNYDTKQGKDRIIFNDKGMTDSYNVNEHGGDIKLRSLFGFKKSIWIHCTGLATEGEMLSESP